MNAPTNPVLHVPAHKQTNPAAKPGQISPHNVRAQAVKQDKEKSTVTGLSPLCLAQARVLTHYTHSEFFYSALGSCVSSGPDQSLAYMMGNEL